MKNIAATDLLKLLEYQIYYLLEWKNLKEYLLLLEEQYGSEHGMSFLSLYFSEHSLDSLSPYRIPGESDDEESE